jgi:hypothetical protein
VNSEYKSFADTSLWKIPVRKIPAKTLLALLPTRVSKLTCPISCVTASMSTCGMTTSTLAFEVIQRALRLLVIFTMPKMACLATGISVFVGGQGISPCRKYPCANIVRAIADSCAKVGLSDFKCECQPNFTWDDDSNSCTAGSKRCSDRNV